MSALYAALPGVHRGSLLAQLSTVPLHAQCGARRPRPAGDGPRDLARGTPVPRPPRQIPVTDLAVTADARRLHLVSVSRRRPVHTLLLNAVDLAYHSHPLARFLVEAPVALAAPCTGFDWGAASALPFLPALRYGRTIVSPARWILTASDLPGPSAGLAAVGRCLRLLGCQAPPAQAGPAGRRRSVHRPGPGRTRAPGAAAGRTWTAPARPPCAPPPRRGTWDGPAAASTRSSSPLIAAGQAARPGPVAGRGHRPGPRPPPRLRRSALPQPLRPPRPARRHPHPPPAGPA